MEKYQQIRNNLNKYRLYETEKDALTMLLVQLNPNDKAYLFGSRLDLNASGGDIDLIVISNSKEYNYLDLLKKTFVHHCNEKIDIILINPNDISQSQQIFFKTIDNISNNLITDENDYPLNSLEKNKIEQLILTIDKSIKALEKLEIAVKELDSIDITKPIDEKDMILLDGELIRFQRAYETLIYFFKTYDRFLEGDNYKTLRDTLLLMEKIGLITNIDLWLEMKKIRNQIAHIYLEDFLNITTKITVQKMSKYLLDLSNKLLEIKNKLTLNN